MQQASASDACVVRLNIELKYPTEAELQSMASRWYSRNYFVDAVLKVLTWSPREHRDSCDCIASGIAF